MKLIVNNTDTKLIIGGIDNLLECDLEQEIYDYMSVKVDGAHFAKKKQNFHWDGYKHLYNKKTKKFATGFLPVIVKLTLELGARIVEIVDERRNLPEFVPIAQRRWDYIDNLEMREYQQDTVNKFDNYIDYGEGRLLYFPRGISDSATNAGKGAILRGIANNVIDAQMLLLIDGAELFDQLYNLLSKDFSVGRINPRYSKTEDSPAVPARFEWGDDITLAMVQTLHSKAKNSINIQNELRTRFNILGVDEAHKASASYYSDITMWTDAGMKVFVSGTPLKTANRINSMIIVGLSGSVLKQTSKKFLMDEGVSMRVKVFVHLNPTFTTGLESYETRLRNGIWESNTRCDIIAKIIEERPGKKILINFRVIDHGEFMLSYLREVHDIKGIELVHGTSANRRATLARFRSGETLIVIASDIWKEGISIDDINTLVYARAEKAKIAISQWSGRIERMDKTQEYAELHEFWDDAKVLEDHSRARLKFLAKEGFEINYLYEHRRGKPFTKR